MEAKLNIFFQFLTRLSSNRFFFHSNIYDILLLIKFDWFLKHTIINKYNTRQIYLIDIVEYRKGMYNGGVTQLKLNSNFHNSNFWSVWLWVWTCGSGYDSTKINWLHEFDFVVVRARLWKTYGKLRSRMQLKRFSWVHVVDREFYQRHW